MTAGCPSEDLLAAHADGELPSAEARELTSHLPDCARCRSLVAALRGEGRLLARVLEEAAAPAPAPRAILADLATVGFCLLGAAAGLEFLFGWIGDLGRQSPVDVDASSFVVSVLFDTFFYLLREGASMLTPLLTAVAVVGFFAVLALLVRSMRRRSVAGALLIALPLFALAIPATALERRVARGDHEDIVVPAGETIDDSLLAAGETVSIDGVVTGNLIACAQRVVVRGTVKGDLVTAGQRVDIAGTVEGNVIAASQTLIVRAPVGRSLHAFTEHLTLDREAKVEGDLVSFAGGMDLEGRVGRDLLALGGVASVKGDIGRNASTWTDRVRIDRAATIGGDLTTHSKAQDKVVVDPGATVRGKTDTRVETRHRTSRYARPSFYAWKLIWLAAAFLTGFVAQRLAPALFTARLGPDLPVSRTLGFGFLAMIAPPVAVVLLAVTVIGLPLALLALASWCAALYLSFIVAGTLVGRAVLTRGDGASTPSFALVLLVGLAVLTLAVNVPFVGWLVKPFVTLFGLGIAVIQAHRAWRAAPAA